MRLLLLALTLALSVGATAQPLEWSFPLETTHDGLLLGNAAFGVMIWGEGRTLRLTLGRADFWDHQGGHPFDPRLGFSAIRRRFEQGDLEPIYEALGRLRQTEMKPTVLPIGRLDIDLGEGIMLKRGILYTETGQVELVVGTAGGERSLRFVMDPERPLVFIDRGDGPPMKVRPVTAWHFEDAIKGRRPEEPGLQGRGIPRPEPFTSDQKAGWVQRRILDPPLAVAYAQTPGSFVVAADTASSADAAIRRVTTLLESALREGFGPTASRAEQYRTDYRQSTPAVELPDEDVRFAYRYGMYKFGAATRPEGPALTLQGPWIDAYQMPPWLSDYHFNINVQMSYWPALPGNHPEHLLPLFRMLERNQGVFRENARVFLGIENGLKIPHATDDRGTRLIPELNGGYMDPGSTLWPALMMFEYYEYTLDEAFLRETAYPFMQGAFNMLYAMLEEKNGRYRLLANSPEYYTGSKGKGGIGINPTFQLVLAHHLSEALQRTARLLGLPADPRWSAVRERLPVSTVIEGRLAVWEGQPYTAHRHFSHLAGASPFDFYDTADSFWNRILRNSYREWNDYGMEGYPAWSYPWAVMLHTRFGEAERAVETLKAWRKGFTSKGHGTLHQPMPPGKEIMQLEAGLGMAGAVLYMLAHEQNGIVHLFRGIPEAWEGVRFERIRLKGGFFLSADRDRRTVEIESTRGGDIVVAAPWNGPILVSRDGQGEFRQDGSYVALSMGPGERVVLHAN